MISLVKANISQVWPSLAYFASKPKLRQAMPSFSEFRYVWSAKLLCPRQLARPIRPFGQAGEMEF